MLITNVGIIPVTDVLFQDVIPEGTTFVDNSVTIGGIQQPGLNPEIGFTVTPLLNTGASISVTFQVTITEIPDNEVILNDADVTFTSQPNPQEPPITQTILTNLVVTTINIASISPVKIVDKEAATVGEILTYDVLISNFGTVPATNVQFLDSSTSGVAFVPGSVSINGIPEPGLDPFIGFTVPDIPVGDSVLVTYREMVTSIPQGGTVVNFVDVTATFAVSETEPPITETTTSNTTLTEINEPGLNVLKSVSQPVVAVGDTITYTTVVQNTGTVIATNVQYSDVLPSSITFVPSSVTINGVLQPGFNPNNGFTLPDINPGESVEVTFQVTVVSVPSNGTIANTANVTGSFILVPGEPPVIVNQPSNTTLTTVNRGRFTVIKQVNRAATLVGDVLTYTVQITNTGTITANDVQFVDIISVGASFVPNSVTINGATQPTLNPITGFGVGDIPVGETVIVTFQATVTNIPSSGTITNVANITGSFTLVPGEPPVIVNQSSNTTITSVNRGRFNIIKQ